MFCFLFYYLSSSILSSKQKSSNLLSLQKEPPNFKADIYINSDSSLHEKNMTFINKIINIQQFQFNYYNIFWNFNNCTVYFNNIKFSQPFHMKASNNTLIYINNSSFLDLHSSFSFFSSNEEQKDSSTTIYIRNSDFRNVFFEKPFADLTSSISLVNTSFYNTTSVFPLFLTKSISCDLIKIMNSDLYSFAKSFTYSSFSNTILFKTQLNHSFINQYNGTLTIQKLKATEIRIHSFLMKLKTSMDVTITDSYFNKIAGPITFLTKTSYSSLVSIKNSQNISFHNCLFTFIHSPCIITNNISLLSLTNCTWSFSYDQTLFSISSKSILFSKCLFNSITTIVRSPLSIQTNSNMIVNNCTFLNCNSKTSGGVFFVSDQSAIKLVNIICKYCSSEEEGGIMFLRNSSIQTDSCTFHFNKAKFAPCFSLINPMSVNIKRTEAKRHYGKISFLFIEFDTNTQYDVVMSIDSVRIDDSYEKAVLIIGKSFNISKSLKMNNAYFRCASRCIPVWQHIELKELNISQKDSFNKNAKKFDQEEENAYIAQSHTSIYIIASISLYFAYDLLKGMFLHFKKHKKNQKEMKYEA